MNISIFIQHKIQLSMKGMHTFDFKVNPIYFNYTTLKVKKNVNI